uniref:Uncharacterized protein n=1 Tax=Musa acuminata subsp. malaccensis TaxID=214687 RepID=A0A804IPU5_MUSAM
MNQTEHDIYSSGDSSPIDACRERERERRDENKRSMADLCPLPSPRRLNGGASILFVSAISHFAVASEISQRVILRWRT